jgi:hypothetical protein
MIRLRNGVYEHAVTGAGGFVICIYFGFNRGSTLWVTYSNIPNRPSPFASEARSTSADRSNG